MTLKAKYENKQERILNAATKVIFTKGLQHVVIDEIINQAGVAKMTFYKYFVSKQELVVATIERAEDCWWDYFETMVNSRATTPVKKIMIIFEILIEYPAKEGDNLQPINNEFEYTNHLIYPMAFTTEMLLLRLHRMLDDLISQAQIANPDKVIKQLLILISGLSIIGKFAGEEYMKSSAQLSRTLAMNVISTNLKEISN